MISFSDRQQNMYGSTWQSRICLSSMTQHDDHVTFGSSNLVGIGRMIAGTPCYKGLLMSVSEGIDVLIIHRGIGHNHDLQRALSTSTEAASIDEDIGTKIHHHLRFMNQVQLVQEGKAPKTSFGRYCNQYEENLDNNQTQVEGKLRSHMKDPYNQIYADNNSGREDDNMNDKNDREYLYLDVFVDDSDSDEDYCDVIEES